MPTDPPLYRKNGWVRGLIHFHTRFSDGWATVQQAGEVAKNLGYDFLLVTDHIRNLKLETHRTLDEYIAACDQATKAIGIPIIPGGEIEVHWERQGLDQSEGHTLAFSVRSMANAGVFDWRTFNTDPHQFWGPDADGKYGSIPTVQAMLQQFSLPRVASHQFMHSYLGAKRGEHSDYRYDLQTIRDADYVDFFYSGTVDTLHESEDIELIKYCHELGMPLKAVYASCDYHAGPEVFLPAFDHFIRAVPFLGQAYHWLFRTVSSAALRWLRRDPEQAAFPLFAEEQLSHATYVHIGDADATEETILGGLRNGRTCITRGTAEFAFLTPPPDLATVYTRRPELQLELPKTYGLAKYQRPHHVIVLRDGEPVHFEPFYILSPDISFSWQENYPQQGVHVYQLYVPSKFLSSPIQFETPLQSRSSASSPLVRSATQL